MKSILGIALGLLFCSTPGPAGSFGGFGGLYFDANSRTLYIPQKLSQRMVIKAEDESLNLNKTIPHALQSENFVQLRNMADTRARISAQSELNEKGSYTVESGDAIDEVNLIGRRTAIRKEVIKK